MSVKVNDSTVDMIVDTGASTDILDEVTHGKVNHRRTLNYKL
jgi:predicted aspartyl protease